jgi:hypothetical protein
MPTRTACVIAGASPEQVRAAGTNENCLMRANRLGTLVTGRPSELVVEYAFALSGPVYDVMWNPETGWFAVTIYRGEQAVRWDNRPGSAAGYPRVGDVLGAATPQSILEALDIPADAIGYTSA